MKISIAVIVFLSSLLPSNLLAQSSTNTCEEAAYFILVLEKYHYEPQHLNDQLSERIYKNFIQLLDPVGFYFTQKDIDTLSSFKFEIDDQIKNNTCDFLTLASELYYKQLLLVDSAIVSILSDPFDLTVDEEFKKPVASDSNYASNTIELVKRWETWLKYLMVDDVAEQIYLQQMTRERIDSVLSHESELRIELKDGIIKRHKRRIKTLEVYDNFIFSHFMDAIATSFDPHTKYFSTREKEEFEEMLSVEVYKFGFDLGENKDGEIAITYVFPGGPAWKSNNINKGDVLIQIRLAGQKLINVSKHDLDEIDYKINSSPADEIKLTLRKATGQISSITLTKEKIEVEENSIKSFILEGDQRIGYISLPGFYTDWKSDAMLGCANDVAKEIIKMQKEDIDGLILDVRNNGGGSLKEAVDLAGIFISEGPFTIVSSRVRKPTLVKDMNRGTIYDGPLVLMINGSSASASEFLAIALQDYNRAIIVGSPSFGKATGQIIIPVDTSIDLLNVNSRPAESDNGYTKVTSLKFYRIDGSTYQKTGIIPDIPIRDLFFSSTFREAKYPYVLPSDSIVKKVYFTPLPELPLAELKQKSKDRLLSDERFIQITAVSDSMTNSLFWTTKIPLNVYAYCKEEENIYDLWTRLENLIERKTELFAITNHEYDLEIIQMNTHRKKLNDNLKEEIKNDIYIEEAYSILNDFINLNEH
ncbi:MAG: carboxy terminal-processing peptidase [Bacteroidetes bacterium]|nr:carboxy terminal-processing peptidase [Bacteroidota bacterium]